MNQSLLTRLFKTINAQENTPIVKIAYKIIEDEQNKGHNRLADKLSHILEGNLAKSNYEAEPNLKISKKFTIPADRRYRLPLATHVEHENLRHYMVLAPNIEEKIQRIEKEFLARERLAHHGLKPRKKILLHGSSGCGKSMTAERLAWNLGLPFYKVRFDSVISSYLGESASNLKNLFDSVKDYPCVLLLDEFEIIGKSRGHNSSDVGEIHRIVNIVLGLLEDYDGKGILVATTNLEGFIDSALFRRFDDIIELPKPSKTEIIKLLKISFSALNFDKNISLNNYASRMVGLSYALIVKIANDAAKKSVISGRKEILLEDLEMAIKENEAFDK